MLYEIPLDVTAPAFSFEVELGGQLYQIELAWNTRGAFWSLNLLLLDGTPLALGVRLVADWDLLSQFNDPRLPSGRLLLVDMDGSGPPNRDDLGTRCLLVYDDGE